MGENETLNAQKILKNFLIEVFGFIYSKNPDELLDIGEPYEQFKHSKEAISKLKDNLRILEEFEKLVLARIYVNKIFEELWVNINDKAQSVENITGFWIKKFLDLDKALSSYSKLMSSFDLLSSDLSSLIESTNVGKNRVNMFRELTIFNENMDNSIVGKFADLIKERKFDEANNLLSKVKERMRKFKD